MFHLCHSISSAVLASTKVSSSQMAEHPSASISHVSLLLTALKSFTMILHKKIKSAILMQEMDSYTIWESCPNDVKMVVITSKVSRLLFVSACTTKVKTLLKQHLKAFTQTSNLYDKMGSPKTISQLCSFKMDCSNWLKIEWEEHMSKMSIPWLSSIEN